MKKKKSPISLHLETKAIHGSDLEQRTGPVSLPIHQTSTYRFTKTEEAIRWAEGDETVYTYTRYHNPTTDEVQRTLALLMDTEDAILFSSGMAAITSSILTLVKSGQEIISSPSLYGGTYRFFRDELPKLGIGVRYFDPSDPTQLKKMIREETALIYAETPTNPSLAIIDLKKLVTSVHRAESKLSRNVYIMIDNTFATIVNQQPFNFGADVIVESLSKYTGGHSDLIGGVAAARKVVTKRIRQTLKSFGGSIDPFVSYLLYRSLKTFPLRVERQNQNALELATYLEKHPKVRRVFYPGLKSHPHHAIAKKQMRRFGGMVTIEVPGGAERAARVVDNLQIAVNAMSLGGVETLVSIPVYSSHIHMTEAELELHGVTPGMIRISAGIENIDDLKEDFNQALRTA
jgi:cystathionine beta-lyase/cystathionine gamma-synthase